VTKEVSVRRAVADDAGQVLVLQRAAYVLDAQLYGDPMIEPLTETFEDVKLAVFDPGTVLLVAAAGERVVGFVRGRIDRRSCRIDRLAVAPDRQGVGVGSALVVAIEAAVLDLVVDGGPLGPGPVEELLADDADRGQARVRLFVRHGVTETYRDAAGPDRVRIYLRKVLPRTDDRDPHPTQTPRAADPSTR
jgi:ribosomal protein S18 acetylase RimI-like enzyme